MKKKNKNIGMTFLQNEDPDFKNRILSDGFLQRIFIYAPLILDEVNFDTLLNKPHDEMYYELYIFLERCMVLTPYYYKLDKLNDLIKKKRCS